MLLKPLKIGAYTIKYPVVQGGMGIGISWDNLAGSVSNEGGLGVISAIGTGYYKNRAYIHKSIEERPYEVDNFYSKRALVEIFKNAREICKNKPLACNILHAINNYSTVVKDACYAGANIIITGAGLPTNMPELTIEYPDVALVPIVSSPKALRIICKRWMQRYKRVPDAIIVEGPLSGGHQGFTYEQCFKKESALENIVPAIKEEIKKWGDFPLIAAGGIFDNKDIQNIISLGANGVQLGTRFIGTYECDAPKKFKDILLKAKKEDIVLIKSPVGYPARAIKTNIINLLDKKSSELPSIKCISNCVVPCKRGKEAKLVGYCIADRLGDSSLGDENLGLFFTGSNGYKVKELISVKELMKKLIYGEDI